MLRGEAHIPGDVEFGVMCEVGGIVQTDDWKIVGTVKAIDDEANEITFETEAFYKTLKAPRETKKGDPDYAGVRAAAPSTKSQIGNLAYRLPKNRTLPMNVGDPITIMHDHHIHDNGVAWDIRVSSGRELIFASSHLHDKTPPYSSEKAEILFGGVEEAKSIFYWSCPEDDDKNQILRGDIGLRQKLTDGKTEECVVHSDGGDTKVVELAGNRYAFEVLTSDLYTNPIPNSRKRQHVDDEVDGTLTLECILVKLTDEHETRETSN